MSDVMPQLRLRQTSLSAKFLELKEVADFVTDIKFDGISYADI